MCALLSTVTLLALTLSPQAGSDPVARAQQLLFQQKPADAVAVLEAAVADDPDNSRAWLLLATARQRAGDLESAVVAAERARSFADTALRARVRLALLAGAQERLDDAFELLGEVRDEGSYDLTRLAFDPDAGPLREDPRWSSLFPAPAAYDDTFVEPVRILGEWRGEAPGGQFGWIARNIGDVDGDGVDDFTTSAPSDSRRVSNGGSVYAYSSASGELLWTVFGEEGSQLGLGLDAAGDVNADGVPDVLAGAPPVDEVLVLSGVDGEVLLRLRPEARGEGFGTQVSDLGDVDGDSHADLVVGAPTADEGGEDAGRVYVLSGADGSILWSAVGTGPGERLGSTVAGGGSGGEHWIVAGADQAPTGGGRAYVWRNLGEAPAFFIEPEPTAAAMGGMFASVPGDVDGDGVTDLYVSDWADGAKGPQTGRIYVASGADGSRILTIAGESSGDGFGIGPADAGDVDGDGHADLVVGAWQQGDAAPAGGKVYLYSGRTGELLWSLTSKVMGETFGFDATGMGDVDGDGAVDFLLTSAWSFVNGPRTGRVFLVAGPRFP